MKCGEELESDRYLITVEEEKQSCTASQDDDCGKVVPSRQLCGQQASSWKPKQESSKRKKLVRGRSEWSRIGTPRAINKIQSMCFGEIMKQNETVGI